MTEFEDVLNVPAYADREADKSFLHSHMKSEISSYNWKYVRKFVESFPIL